MSLDNFERDINQALERNENSNLKRYLTEDAKPNVQDRSCRVAYDNIFTVLKGLPENGRNEDTDQLLKFSAELLEGYLNSASAALSPEAYEQMLYDSAMAYYLSGNYARAYVLLKKAQAHISNSGRGLVVLFLLRILKDIQENAANVLRIED